MKEKDTILNHLRWAYVKAKRNYLKRTQKKSKFLSIELFMVSILNFFVFLIAIPTVIVSHFIIAFFPENFFQIIDEYDE